MGTWTRFGAVLLLGCTLAACTGSGQSVDPSISTATGGVPTPSSLSPALPWPAAPTSALPAENDAAMLAEMQRWVDAGFLPGATAAVVSPLGVWTAAVGVDGQGATLEATSGMALAQITRTFVAAEALLLAEQGTLDLDAPASTLPRGPSSHPGIARRQEPLWPRSSALVLAGLGVQRSAVG